LLEVVAQAGSLAQAREMLDRRILVVVLTATIEAEHHGDVLKAGADAELHKVASIPTIVEEVRRLAGG
jgi:DNA-binding NarL/FixJ family response regulator